MKKGFLLFILLVIIKSNYNAQVCYNWDWSEAINGSGDVTITDVATDKSMNVFVTGYFKDTITYMGTTLVSNGQEDLFLFKLNPTGTINWAFSGGSPSRDDRGNGITIDNNDDIILVGRHGGTPGAGAVFGSNSYTAGLYNLLMIKFDSNGNLIWVNSHGNSNWNHHEYNDVTTDSLNNIYATGTYQNEDPFDPLQTSVGGKDIIVSKYNSSGSLMWYKKSGGITSGDEGHGIDIDKNNNVIVAGGFGGVVDFGGTNILTSSAFLIGPFLPIKCF